MATLTEQLMNHFRAHSGEVVTTDDIARVLDRSVASASATVSLLRQQTGGPDGDRALSPIVMRGVGRYIYNPTPERPDPWSHGTPPELTYGGLAPQHPVTEVDITATPFGATPNEKLTLEILRRGANGRILAVDSATDKTYVLRELDP